jgi:ferredoxin
MNGGAVGATGGAAGESGAAITATGGADAATAAAGENFSGLTRRQALGFGAALSGGIVGLRLFEYHGAATGASDAAAGQNHFLSQRIAAATHKKLGGILPPGAGSASRFASKCTTCLLCLTNCQGKVLRAPDEKVAAVHLDFERGMCEFNCHNCTRLCPTGALQNLTREEKQRRRIGLVDFVEDLCIAVMERQDCGACAEHCPTHAVEMIAAESDGARVPHVNHSLCIGCGACEYACPVGRDRAGNRVGIPAITVTPVSQQVVAAVMESHPPEPPHPDDAWLR